MKQRRPSIAIASLGAAAEGRRLLRGAVITLLAAVLLSAALGVAASGRHQEKLALAMARSFFEETVALRSWVSEQGGLYVPRSDSVPPNPWLPADQREIIDRTGRSHVMLNPAYLTRLLASRTEASSGVTIRLIDRSPLNPDNVPDPWEDRALEGLDDPGAERWEVDEGPSGRRFRYLATLEREPSCVAGCHAAARELPGETLGAISVAFDQAPFASAGREQAVAIVLGHAFVLAVALLLLRLLGRRLDRHLLALRAAGERIGALERLLPICAWCKRIRPEEEQPDREADWVRVEDYIADHVEAEFTHGMCPDCATKMFRDELADGRRDGPW